MHLDLILLLFLFITMALGMRLHFDIKKLKGYKGDFDKILKKTEQSLTDLENTTERFRYILNTEKDSLQRLIQKANAVKDKVKFLDTEAPVVDTNKNKRKESPKVQSRKRKIVQSAESLR